MKLLAIFILTLYLNTTSFGQTYPNKFLDSLCNVTIRYYYTDFTKPLDSVEALNFKPRNAFILKSELTPTLESDFKHFVVRYVTQQEALEEFVKTKKRTGSLEKISVTQLQDTINIDIGGWVVNITKVKIKNGKPVPVNSNFFASCRGTLGYIPTCRFIYDRTTNSWTRYTWQETADAIIKTRQGDSAQ